MKLFLQRCFYYFLIFYSTCFCAQNSNHTTDTPVVEKILLHSYVLNEDREIFVYHPDDTINTYPVLYILDGERKDYFNQCWGQLKLNQHIIVGINNSINRNQDLIPCKNNTRPGSGKSDKFLSFINEELIPFIDQRFSSNKNRTLFGASNGGLFTLYVLLNRKEMFSSYISISPTIGHCNTFMEQNLKNLEISNSSQPNKIYINYGTKDPMYQVTDYIQNFCSLLQNKFGDNLKIKFDKIIDGKHIPEGSIQKGLTFIHKSH